jgi:hypothetical protein
LTIGLFEAQVSFAQPAACEGADGAMPDAISEVLATDICSSAGGGDVAPVTVPPEATSGPDVAPLEAVGVLKRWRCGGPGAWGGFIAGRGWAPVERLLRTLLGELVAAGVDLLRLCPKGGAGGSRGCGVERALHALVTTVLWRVSGCEARRQEA